MVLRHPSRDPSTHPAAHDLLTAMGALGTALRATEVHVRLVTAHPDGRAAAAAHARWSPTTATFEPCLNGDTPLSWPKSLGDPRAAPTAPELVRTTTGGHATWLVCADEVLGLLELDASPRAPALFDAATRAPLLDDLRTALRRTWCAHTRALEPGAHAVLTPDATLVYADPAARALLDPAALAHLGVALTSQPTPFDLPLGLALARAHRVDADGDHRFVVRLDPATRIQRSPCDTLPNRRRRVAELVSDGLSDAAIAKELGITIATVKTHLRKIFATLGIQSRVELALCSKKGH